MVIDRLETDDKIVSICTISTAGNSTVITITSSTMGYLKIKPGDRIYYESYPFLNEIRLYKHQALRFGYKVNKSGNSMRATIPLKMLIKLEVKQGEQVEFIERHGQIWLKKCND